MRLWINNVRRATVVAPHPDDEIIGAAGLIQALRQQGSAVQVIVVSDGAASHRDSPRWPRARLVAARRRESLRALRRLAVLPGAVTFLGLPDGALSLHRERARQRLRRELARCPPDLLVAPMAGDAHPDHRAVAAMLESRHARRVGYQVWPPRQPRRARCRRIVAPGGAFAKRSLIKVYRTQLGAMTDDPAGFSIAPHELAIFAHPIERFVELQR